MLSKDLIASLEIGESSLHLTDPRGFDAAKIDSVTIEAGGGSKTAVRVQAGEEGQQVKTWADEATKKPNQTIANFIDNANNLRPSEYSPDIKTQGAKEVVKLTYKDERGAVLGTLTLYKHDKQATPPEGAPADPAAMLKTETEYFIMTPRTRVPAVVRKDTAERAEQDVPTVFSDKPVESVNPKGNPFGKLPKDALSPTPGPGSGAAPPPGMGSGAGPSLKPGAGSAAAPAPGAGSAAKAPAAPPAEKPATPPAPKAGAGSAAAPKATPPAVKPPTAPTEKPASPTPAPAAPPAQ